MENRYYDPYNEEDWDEESPPRIKQMWYRFRWLWSNNIIFVTLKLSSIIGFLLSFCITFLSSLFMWDISHAPSTFLFTFLIGFGAIVILVIVLSFFNLENLQ